MEILELKETYFLISFIYIRSEETKTVSRDTTSEGRVGTLPERLRGKDRGKVSFPVTLHQILCPGLSIFDDLQVRKFGSM